MAVGLGRVMRQVTGQVMGGLDSGPWMNPLQSPHWHRVAALRPRLAAGVQVSRLWSRGQRWHVMHDAERRHSCRLNAQAYEVAARLDGQASVDEIWRQLDQASQQASHQVADQEPPSQDDIIELLSLLHVHQLLAHDQCPDFGTLQDSKATPATDPTGRKPDQPGSDPAQSIWAWRLPLLNPSAWLNARASWAQALFSRSSLVIWLLLMAWLATLWALNASSLQDHAQRWLLTPRYLWLSLLIYPLIKAVHEAAHALAVHRFGGQVTSCGLSLMMLVPVPYVDASAAHAFPQARHRALVSAAGIMAELALAALGLSLWAWLEPGLSRDIGFLLFFMGCTSTLLFNGNPLQRMDGYHLLTDALDLPGLATRSNRWWQTRLLTGLMGAQAQLAARPMDEAPPAEGERPWLWAYAPLAWAYQWGLWVGISLWLGAWSAPLGWGMAAVVIMRLGVLPWSRLWRQVWRTHLHGAHPTAAPWRALALLLTPWLFLALPMPDSTLVQGVVWAPEQALIRPEVEGQVEQVLLADGEAVLPGQALLQLSNPKLLAQREHVAAQWERAQQQAYQHLGINGSQSGQASSEAEQLQQQLSHLDEQIRALTVTAHQAGRLRWPQAQDLPGRYLRRGELVGHIVDGQAVVVRLALPQDKGHAVVQRTDRASVRLVGTWEHGHPAQLIRDSVGATRQLHSAALSDVMGGEIVTDPKDEQHLQTQRPVVVMDVRVPELAMAGAPGSSGPAVDRSTEAHMGQRAWVRLEHGLAPLAWQWLNLARLRADAVFSAR